MPSKNMLFKNVTKLIFDPTAEQVNDMLNRSKEVPEANSLLKPNLCTFRVQNYCWGFGAKPFVRSANMEIMTIMLLAGN